MLRIVESTRKMVKVAKRTSRIVRITFKKIFLNVKIVKITRRMLRMMKIIRKIVRIVKLQCYSPFTTLIMHCLQ